MVELDQFKYTLSTYEKPLQEVRESLNLDAKIRRIDELDKTMEEPSFWEDAELSTRLVKEAKHLKDTVAEFNRLQNQYEEIGLMIEMGYEENDPAIIPEIQEMLDEFTSELDALRLRTLLTGDYDNNNALLRLPERAEPSPATGAACYTACTAAGQREKAIRSRSSTSSTARKPVLSR